MSEDNELQRSLGRIEGKIEDVLRRLDEHKKTIDHHIDHDDERFSAHDRRIAVTESNQGAAKLIAKVGAFMIALVGIAQIGELWSWFSGSK